MSFAGQSLDHFPQPYGLFFCAYRQNVPKTGVPEKHFYPVKVLEKPFSVEG